jgi:hypothetical protein
VRVAYLKTLSGQLACGRLNSQFLMIQRSFDSTPHTVEFGHLYDELHNTAKYWHKDTGVRWSRVSLAEATSHKLHTKAGAVELMADTAQIA